MTALHQGPGSCSPQQEPPDLNSATLASGNTSQQSTTGTETPALLPKPQRQFSTPISSSGGQSRAEGDRVPRGTHQGKASKNRNTEPGTTSVSINPRPTAAVRREKRTAPVYSSTEQSLAALATLGEILGSQEVIHQQEPTRGQAAALRSELKQLANQLEAAVSPTSRSQPVPPDLARPILDFLIDLTEHFPYLAKASKEAVTPLLSSIAPTIREHRVEDQIRFVKVAAKLEAYGDEHLRNVCRASFGTLLAALPEQPVAEQLTESLQYLVRLRLQDHPTMQSKVTSTLILQFSNLVETFRHDPSQGPTVNDCCSFLKTIFPCKSFPYHKHPEALLGVTHYLNTLLQATQQDSENLPRTTDAVLSPKSCALGLKAIQRFSYDIPLGIKETPALQEQLNEHIVAISEALAERFDRLIDPHATAVVSSPEFPAPNQRDASMVANTLSALLGNPDLGFSDIQSKALRAVAARAVRYFLEDVERRPQELAPEPNPRDFAAALEAAKRIAFWKNSQNLHLQEPAIQALRKLPWGEMPQESKENMIPNGYDSSLLLVSLVKMSKHHPAPQDDLLLQIVEHIEGLTRTNVTSMQPTRKACTVTLKAIIESGAQSRDEGLKVTAAVQKLLVYLDKLFSNEAPRAKKHLHEARTILSIAAALGDLTSLVPHVQSYVGRPPEPQRRQGPA